MYKLFKYLLLFFLLQSISHQSFAERERVFGGEINYECLGNGRFKVISKIYYLEATLPDLPEIQRSPWPQFIRIYNLDQDSSKFETVYLENYDPIWDKFYGAIECYNNVPNLITYTINYTNIIELEPNQRGYGLVLTHCCRNTSNFYDLGMRSYVYLNHIPAFSNINECPNNSAKILDSFPKFVCIDEPFQFSFKANDLDQDSITYELCKPLTDPSLNSLSGPVRFSYRYPFINAEMALGFTYKKFIPSTFEPQLDAQTGTIYFRPTAIGTFSAKICANEWRNGRIINSSPKEFTYTVIDCNRETTADIGVNSDIANTAVVNCENYTVSFKNMSKNASTYTWTFGFGNDSSNLFEPIITFPDTGTYPVKLIVNKGLPCADSIIRYVRIYPTFKSDFITEGALCNDALIIFQDNSQYSFGNIIEQKWLFSHQTPFSYSEYHEKVGDLKYRTPHGEDVLVQYFSRNDKGCRDSISKWVNIENFQPSAGNDTIIVLGSKYSMQARGGVQIQWETSPLIANDTDYNTPVYFTEIGEYKFIANFTSMNSCYKSDTINIKVIPHEISFLPNAFTPNNDGLNDLFKPIQVGYSRVRAFKIYNRIGQLVYYSVKSNEGWDGTLNNKECPSDVYFWFLELEMPNGTTIVKKGDVTLLR